MQAPCHVLHHRRMTGPLGRGGLAVPSSSSATWESHSDHLAVRPVPGGGTILLPGRRYRRLLVTVIRELECRHGARTTRLGALTKRWRGAPRRWETVCSESAGGSGR